MMKKSLVLGVYFLLLAVTFSYAVIAIKPYSRPLNEVLLGYSNIIDLSVYAPMYPEMLCGFDIIQDYYSDEPKIVIPPGYKNYWISGDTSEIRISSGKKVRIPTAFFVLGNTDLELRSFMISKDEVGEHAQIWGCAYKGRIPFSKIMEMYTSSRPEAETRLYVAVDNKVLRRVK